MLNALFVIGAGVNRCIQSERLGAPPLARDLFSSSLHSVQRMDGYMGSQYRLPEPERSYCLSARMVWSAVHFIGEEFGISRDDLFEQPFNIEDLFTRLELREREARDSGDQALAASIAKHQQTVVSLLAIQLAVFRSAAEQSPPFLAFAECIHRWNASVLTFNYDTFLERALEVTSGRGDPPRPNYGVEVIDVVDGRRGIGDLGFTPWKWDRRLAYHLTFDLVTLPGGYIPPLMVTGKQYYGSVPFLEKPFLKLHGSFNWHRSLGYNVGWGIVDPPALPAEATVMADPDVLAIPITYRTTVLRPLVVAPLAKKDFSEWPFQTIWSEAESLVNGASTLAIVGYSFPPTDRAARKLLSGAASSGQLKRLIVVNPDVAAVKEAQEICDFAEHIDHFPSVEAFLDGRFDA